MEIDAERVYRAYLLAYVEALGGGRLEGTMILAETTPPERAAIALAAHTAKKGERPAPQVAVVKDVREMLRAPGGPAAPAGPPTP